MVLYLDLMSRNFRLRSELPMDISESITYEITKTGNILRKLVTKRLKEAGVNMSPEESVLMNALWNKGELTLTELGEWSVKEPSTLSRQVDGLVKKGYVDRRESSTDRRNQIVSVSKRGQAIRKEFIAAELHLLDEAMITLSNHDRQKVLLAIKAVRNNALAEICRES